MRKDLSGWAFMMKRDLWNQIGGLDNDFDFWFADNSLIGTTKKNRFASNACTF